MYLNLLLADFLTVLTKPNMISAIILLIIGLSISLLATRITKAIRKSSEIKTDDKVVISFQIVGLVLMVVGFVLMAL